MKTKTLKTKTPVFNIEARFAPDTLNEENRTVEMVFTTDAPARMMRWKGWDIEEFNEILSMDPKHVRMNRMENGGAPLLDNHRRWDFSSQIGVVEKAWLVGKELRGLVRFSTKKEADEIFQEVKAGIIRNGSIGYRVHKYEELTKDGDKIRTLRAIDWEPMEMSLVVIPADGNAGVRSEGGGTVEVNECEIVTKHLSDEGENEMFGVKHRTMDKATDAPTGGAAVVAAPTAVAVDEQAIREEGAKAERQRVLDIRQAVKAAKLGDDVADQLIKENKTADQARAFVLEKLASAPGQTTETRNVNVSIEVGTEEREKVREGVSEMILHRALPSKFSLTEKAQAFYARNLVGLMEKMLRIRGINPDRMSVDQVVTKAMALGDLPAIFLDAMNKALAKEIKEAPQSFEPFVERVSFADFRTNHRIKMGDMPGLLPVGQDGEVKKGMFSDEKESFALGSYGRELDITRQMIINDELDFLSRIPRLWGRKAKELEGDLVYTLITTPQVMADGKALFHADHNNVSGAAGAISVTTASAAEKAIMTQLGLDSGKLGLTMEAFLVPVALKTTFEQFVAPVNATEKANVNVFKGKSVIVDQRLDAASTSVWYALSSKDQVDMIELATLNGQGPEFRSDEVWSTRGLKMQLNYDVAAHAIDHRGFYRNAAP